MKVCVNENYSRVKKILGDYIDLVWNTREMSSQDYWRILSCIKEIMAIIRQDIETLAFYSNSCEYEKHRQQLLKINILNKYQDNLRLLRREYCKQHPGTVRVILR